MRRKISIVLATMALLFGIISARALWEGYQALERGNEAMEQKDAKSAIRHWRRAARWYLPLAPHVAAAYDKLRGLAKQAEENKDRETALSAWTAIRSSSLATRHVTSPYSDRRAEADTHIATLMANWERELGSTQPAEARVAWHYAALQKNYMPSVGWSIVALLGLALWIGSGFGFALKGVDENDKIIAKAAGYSAFGIGLGLLIWALGLYLA